MKKYVHSEVSQAKVSQAYDLPELAVGCLPESPCVRCSMIRVATYRFEIFREKFGRPPELSDELFFDETQSQPVRASRAEIKNQIFAAAEAQGLNFFTLLTYLELDSSAAQV
jgi:hypothetical protein